MLKSGFDWVAYQFHTQHKLELASFGPDVLRWLTEGNGIPEQLAVDVMYRFAMRIAQGEVFEPRLDGLKVIDLLVLDECREKLDSINIEKGTKILQHLAGKPLMEKEVYELTDQMLEMMGILYNKVDTLKDQPERLRNFKNMHMETEEKDPERNLWQRFLALFVI